MKKYIIILLAIFLPLLNFAQNRQFYGEPRGIKLDLGYTMDVAYGGHGLIFKGKRQILDAENFDAYFGLAAQFTRDGEKKFTNDVDGFTRDLGLYVVSEVLLYPLRSKNLFLGLEPFAGVTNLKSEGTLEIEDYNVSETFSKNYTYLNYGATLSLGYNFGKIQTSIFAMPSLRALLDKGRFRPGDTDSRILAGVNLGFTLR